ncbi:MAG TPA: CpaD family pilus assembly protein [Hyphomicrobiales bacterium]|nr:CpaD family pilus assembly protein [Hyphomicrobiales bacterium]
MTGNAAMSDKRLSVLRLLAASGIAVLAAACQTDQASVHPLMPMSSAERHPIQVRQGMATLDLLPGAPGGLTAHEAADVRAFAAEWRAQARGPMVIKVPRGGATDLISRYGARAIRDELVAGGVPLRAIRQATYPASGPGHLAPVRLAFAKLEAGLPHPCGQWPTADGRAVGDEADTENQPYWDFGCAQQQDLAAQIADPEDLIHPRAEEAAYAPRRQTVIGKYVQGQSPAAQQPAQTKLSDVGGGQ